MFPTPSRRQALRQLACGVGGIGLSALLAEQSHGAAVAPKPHHAPKAKSLIFLNMMGGPTQFETFDYKPEMHKWAGKTASNLSRDGMVRVIPTATVLPPLFKYLRKGESGNATTEIFPHMAERLDELCIVRTMVADDPSHPGGQKAAMTGYARQAMPSFGSWIMYGLGSENKNLPGFVYLAEGYNHHSGFLPAATQGMPVGSKVPNLKRPQTLLEAQQREQLDLLAQFNREFAAKNPGEDALAARIEAAELAFRMQMSCPEAVDFTKESKAALDLYGASGKKGGAGKAVKGGLPYSADDFGAMCLTARRLVERGVRVVTIAVGGRRGWNQHGNLKAQVEYNAGVIDRGMAALLKDLKDKGLLDSTLVMWGGEFGRTPYAQNGNGRDHFAKGFTYWLAGGGSKKGITYGETDEIGQNIVSGAVHLHDMHATLLHLMGLDPEKLTFKYGGRDQRLTDVNGKVVKGLLG